MNSSTNGAADCRVRLAAAAEEAGSEDSRPNYRHNVWRQACGQAARMRQINTADRGGRTAAHDLARKAGDIELFSIALDAGMDFTLPDGDGAQPIHYLADRRDVIGGNLLRWLLASAGADVNAAAPGGFTALHLACRHADPERVRMLLKRNADLEARLDHEWTPLHFAAMHGPPDVVRLLLAAGADTGARTDGQARPAELAGGNAALLNDRDVMMRLWSGARPGDIRRRRALVGETRA